MLDRCADQKDGEDASGGDLDHGLPGGTTGVAPGFQQVSQLANVPRRMTIFQTKVSETTLGTALGGTVEQIVKILLAQEELPS